jgi:4-hydroxyphenylacetate decarboxylase small subunit
MGINRHIDCEEYLAIDVFKGICRLDKTTRIADEEACDVFNALKKCKFCSQYTEKEEFIGLCKGKDKVYPDLIAKTCMDFDLKVK